MLILIVSLDFQGSFPPWQAILHSQSIIDYPEPLEFGFMDDETSYLSSFFVTSIDIVKLPYLLRALCI